MEPSDKEQFEKVLREQRDQILQHTGSPFGSTTSPGAAGETGSAGGNGLDVDDRIIDSQHKLLEKIEIALQRLADGSYEDCADCGRKIPLARLQAKPAVSLCLECQAKKEAAH